ncbi:MAG: hypothetical protein PHH51_02000 [Bacilli bacterium]|nr:hypothetical protein [Bacilli bacterium]MDD3895860.1 hypothetical protein [Bacilli bacterium]MDD4408029.1 hypothetical protein [Bacilli bacterium]
MFEKRSKLFFAVILIQGLFSIWILFYFNYLDRLNYSESIINNTNDLALLIQNMYTSSWWALIILTICLISIFSIVSFVYRDLKFQFMAILLMIILFILALNFKDSFLNNISVICIFIPVIILNIFCYFKQKKYLT